VAKPIRRLIADLRKGRLTKAKAAELAVGMLMGSPEVPKRYRLGAVTEYDVMVLGVATGASAATPSTPDRSSRAANLCAFLEGVHTCVYASAHTTITYILEGLVSRGDVTGGLLSGLRAYGSVPVVEFFASWTQGDPGVESTFVKELFEAITPLSDDALALINEALGLHGTSVSEVIDVLWWSMYTMCDTNNPWSPFGWCSAFGYTTSPGTPQTQRPAHDVVSLSSAPTGTNTYQLNRYGAEFVDFDLGPVPENVSGTSLVLEFDGEQVTTDDQVLVQAWADTPGGAQCGVSPLSYPASSDDKTAFAFQIPSDCRYATLVAVNKRTGTWSDPVDFPVSWSSFSAGATIGNGTVTLGVNPEGNLGLGVSRSWVCRAAQGTTARYASNPQDQGPALVLDATGFDAIREQSLCYVLPTQGWSVVDPNHTVDGHPATWSKHGLDYPTNYPVSVVSFVVTDTEATSVVALGGHYALTQHWHPSTVDPQVYQLDVTIRQVAFQPLVVDPEPFTYRQVVPLSVASENGDTVAVSVGTGDGVSAATNTIYWPWDPDDAPGFIDDPLVPLPPVSADAANGFALDAAVEPTALLASPDPGPQLTLYYGLADTVTQANSLLNAAGATTRAIAQRTDYDESTLAILVGLHANT